jgi:hypothetical protein
MVWPSVVTRAVSGPAEPGGLVKVRVSSVAVAAVTVATAPLDKTTVLLVAMESKPVPLMVRVSEVATKLPVARLTARGTPPVQMSDWLTAASLSPSAEEVMDRKLPTLVCWSAQCTP